MPVGSDGSAASRKAPPAPQEPGNPGRDKPGLRVAHGLALVGLLVGLAVLDHYVGQHRIFAAALAALVGLALWEFYGLAERAGARPARWYGISAAVLLVAAQWMRGRLPLPIDPLVTVGVAALFGAVVAQVAAHGVTNGWLNLGATVLGLAYIWLPAAFIACLWALGLGPLALAIGTVKLSDVAAYAVGRAIGRRRLAPVVSPNKTVAGAVAGLVAGTIVAAGFCLAAPRYCGGLSPWTGALFGAVVTVFGILGDLGESVLKRAASVKDASGLIPGFGGVLDVLDSLWGAAPVAYAMFRLVGKGGG